MPDTELPLLWGESPRVRLEAGAAARVLPSRRWPGGPAPALAPGSWRLFDERHAVALHLLPERCAEPLRAAMQALAEGWPTGSGRLDPAQTAQKALKAQSDGLYLAILMTRLRYLTRGSAARFFDVLAERHGLPTAVRAYVVALGLTVRVEYEPPPEDSGQPLQIRVWADPTQVGGRDGETTQLCAEMWRVRAWLAHAADAVWLDCAGQLSAALDTLPPARRPLAAVMLPERAALSDRLLAQLLGLEQVPETAQWLLLTVSDPAAVAREVAHAVRVHPAYPIFRKSLYVATLLQERGEAALDVLLPLSGDHDAAADGLVSIGRPEAMTQLCQLALRHADGLQRLQRAVGQWPQLAMRVLAEVLSRQADAAARLYPVLLTLVDHSPRTARKVMPYLDALARAVLRRAQAQLAERGQRRVAALSELPSALMTVQARPDGAVTRMPDFWQPANWPRPVLRASGAVWPDEALAPLGQLLAAPDRPDVSALLSQLRASSVPDTLESFCWQLFLSWKTAGAPEFYTWALTRLAWAGTDGTARRLGATLLDWSAEEARVSMCRLGLGVLREIGSDVALMQIAFVMRHARSENVRQAAQETLVRAARAAGFESLEALLDARVPDLGLGAQGQVVLDFGPRQFSVRLGEQMRLLLSEHEGGHDGRRLTHLPRPQPGDDPALSAAARKRFNALRSDLRLAAGLRTEALETAMNLRRRWPLAHGCRLMSAHPVMRVLVQPLVWCLYPAVGRQRAAPADGQLLPAFRFDLDGRLVGARDDEVSLPPDDGTLRLGLAHPLDLTQTERAEFVAQLADYQLMQPFEQLVRTCLRPEPAELAGHALARWSRRVVPDAAREALRAAGWVGPPDGSDRALVCPVGPDGVVLRLALSEPLKRPWPLPGGDPSLAGAAPNWDVGLLDLVTYSDDGEPGDAQPLTGLDPFVLSEMIRELDLVLTRDPSGR